MNLLFLKGLVTQREALTGEQGSRCVDNHRMLVLDETSKSMWSSPLCYREVWEGKWLAQGHSYPQGALTATQNYFCHMTPPLLFSLSSRFHSDSCLLKIDDC